MIRPVPEDTTRERILKAAILRFSTHSYEETGLRDIAADVGVDMAYVHRSFGSKEKLFREAVKAIVRPEVWLVGEASELHVTLAKEVLAEKGANEIRSFDVLARSFSSPEASRVFRELIDEGLVKPMASKCPVVSEQRASMVAAFLAGVSILRDVIGTPALQSGGNDRELMALVSQVVEFIMNEDKGCQTMTTAVPISREPQ
ncbi:MAG: TetR family transcriptional regulator [Rhizobiales bacterium 63-7]|jgi:AcrR family transcriptional regulator|uniref:TetR family transcriptional regulator n=2 Tax=Shinella zoogloeoides TaxID=352475 RepID=A0A6N8TK71_SHIZO|nr:TetR family transcriptional regulator [Hyphomicrobiales bacterium]MXO02656.1 TetR family transcriptional regulator [Shinella zoogloeoides]OJU67262.1 MAG: TetR family transcriptional regulator [Rhizobiales bacterium 63-7]